MLARMEVNSKSDGEQMLAEISTNTKAIQERMEADRKRCREDLKGMMEEIMNAK
jgi:hypothetical protein